MKLRWILLLAATAGCSSSHPLRDVRDSSPPSDGLVDADSGSAASASTDSASADAASTDVVSTDSASADTTDSAASTDSASTDSGSTDSAIDYAGCGPPMEFATCRTDSDCRSAYLVCVPPGYVTIQVCRDPDAGVDPGPACPFYPEYDTAPICPRVVNVRSTVCELRYQHPCTVDADCGPEGFTCARGHCQEKPIMGCSTAADCPAEWDCYAPCACSGVRAVKSCEPPFVEFHCPVCVVAADGGT
jgi:hypothetical protein